MVVDDVASFTPDAVDLNDMIVRAGRVSRPAELRSSVARRFVINHWLTEARQKEGDLLRGYVPVEAAVAAILPRRTRREAIELQLERTLVETMR